jgi:hypothetical protein
LSEIAALRKRLRKRDAWISQALGQIEVNTIDHIIVCLLLTSSIQSMNDRKGAIAAALLLHGSPEQLENERNGQSAAANLDQFIFGHPASNNDGGSSSSSQSRPQGHRRSASYLTTDKASPSVSTTTKHASAAAVPPPIPRPSIHRRGQSSAQLDTTVPCTVRTSMDERPSIRDIAQATAANRQQQQQSSTR